MQRQVASPTRPQTAGSGSHRLNARYDAHSTLEADLMTLKMLRMDAEKSLNYRLSASSIGSPASPMSTGSSVSYGSKGFDPIVESTPAAAKVAESTIVCLRLFSEKEALASSSSKGMGTWEALYRSKDKINSSDPSSLMAERKTKNRMSVSPASQSDMNASRRIMSFLETIRSVQQGVLSPHVVIIAARQLLKFHDPDSASLLLQGCIQDLLLFYAGLESDNSSMFSGNEEEDPAAIARAQVASQFRRAVQQGVYLPPLESTSDTPPNQVKEAISAQLMALVALDVECAAQTAGVKRSFMYDLLHNEAAQYQSPIPLTEAEIMRCLRELLPSETIEKITTIELGCQMENAQLKEWEKERATNLENRKKVEALTNQVAAMAKVSEKPNATAQTAMSENKSVDASQKSSTPVKQEGLISSLLAFMQQSNGQGFPSKIILLVFVVLTVLGIVLRLGPSILFSIFNSFGSGRAPRTRMLAL